MIFCPFCRKTVPTNISKFKFEEKGKKIEITSHNCMYCAKTIKIERKEK